MSLPLKHCSAILLGFLLTLLPYYAANARPNFNHAREGLVFRSHHKGKRAWDAPYLSTDLQEEPTLSIIEETGIEKGDTARVETLSEPTWLDISREFRETVQISKNSDGVLECEAVGSPPPKVFWLRNGMPLESITIVANEDTRNRIEMGNNAMYDKFSATGMANVKARLPIKCALPEDEGQYTCMAINKGKRTTATTYLSVIEEDPSVARGSCEYRLSSMSFKKTKKGSIPAIISSETFHMETMGRHISLPCKAVGKPRPHITWYDQDGKKIIPGKKHQLSASGSLAIRSLAWKDMGVYTCAAENVHGKDTITTFIYPLSEESGES